MSSRIPLNVFQEYDQKKDFSLNEESLLINQRQSNVVKPKNLNDGLYDSNDLSVNEISVTVQNCNKYVKNARKVNKKCIKKRGITIINL